MQKFILILDKFFLKYEGGIKLTPPQEKLPSKSSTLLRLKIEFLHKKKPSEIFQVQFTICFGQLLQITEKRFLILLLF